MIGDEVEHILDRHQLHALARAGADMVTCLLGLGGDSGLAEAGQLQAVGFLRLAQRLDQFLAAYRLEQVANGGDGEGFQSVFTATRW